MSPAACAFRPRQASARRCTALTITWADGWSRAGTGPAYCVTPIGIFTGKADAALHTIRLIGDQVEPTLI
jgi:hypothetical protein